MPANIRKENDSYFIEIDGNQLKCTIEDIAVLSRKSTHICVQHRYPALDIDQNKLMKFDPAFGSENPYPSNAGQYREYHGRRAWIYNPWTGGERDPSDIGSDVVGLLIVP